MKKRRVRRTMIARVLAVGVAFFGGLGWVATSFPARLKDDTTQIFRVGRHRVQIETKSISISGEDGDAQLFVSAGGKQTILQSSFDYDLWNNFPPGYTSLGFIDDHFGRDLLIWRRRNYREISAIEYISSRDGILHTLSAPLDNPWWFKMVD